MFSRAETFIEKSHAATMQQNWLKSIENLHPVIEEASGSTALSP